MRLISLILTLLTLIFCTFQSHAETTSSVVHIHKIKSLNGDFSLTTYPYDNVDETALGKSVVSNQKGEVLYELPRYFEINSNREALFLSNDGETVAYIINEEFFYEGDHNKSIRLYKRGKLIKEYALSDLITCDPDKETCFLFYNDAMETYEYQEGEKIIHFKQNATDFEKAITQRAVYFDKDTVYIFTKTGQLVTLDLTSTQIKKTTFSEPDDSNILSIPVLEAESQSIECGFGYNLPLLESGLTVERGMADYLDMAVYPEGKKGASKYRRHSAMIDMLVDKQGNATVIKMENYDALPEDRINAFVASQKFNTDKIPPGVGKWQYSGWVSFMNKNKSQAKKEREIEIEQQKMIHQKNLVADSIDGIYIPKNIKDCFLDLDRTLLTKDIETIKNLKDRNETIMYHHGFGTWLRNNWGLWGGSRLQTYFIERGVRHPDSMSSKILEFYYDWLNNEHKGWEAFHEKHSAE